MYKICLVSVTIDELLSHQMLLYLCTQHMQTTTGNSTLWRRIPKTWE